MLRRLLKNLYSSLPFKRQIFEVLKIVYTPSRKVYKHLHFEGIFRVKVDQNRSFKIRHYGFVIENEIFWEGLYGGWEKQSMRLWKNLCEEATAIFDVGANTGIYSLVAKSVKPEAQVFAFEPVRRVFEKLEANASLNRYEINCVPKALSNYAGSATIYDRDTDHTLSVTVNKNLLSGPDIIEVEIETTTLEAFIKANNIQKVDLMKIDVETHEVEVLQGFGEYLTEFKPTLLIEILNDEVARGVEEIIQHLEYLYFNIDEEVGIRQVDHLSQSDTFNYLVCDELVARRLKLL